MFFGGGETYHKVPPPEPVLEASENGIRLGPCPIRKMTGREQRGGGKRIISGGGPKPFLGRGFIQGAAKRGRQKEFDHSFFLFSGKSNGGSQKGGLRPLPAICAQSCAIVRFRGLL